jgi:hypothetical protein
MKRNLKMKQILAAPWDGATGRTYSIFALGRDGVVYRFDGKCTGWIPQNMAIAKCSDTHKK